MKNRSLLNVGNKYGYQINVSHPAIIEVWERFKVKWKNGELDTELPIYSDTARRIEFEKAIFKSKWFQSKIKKRKAAANAVTNQKTSLIIHEGIRNVNRIIISRSCGEVNSP